MPVAGWIDFGTGRKPPEATRAERKPSVDPSVRPSPAKTGPLVGHRLVIIGERKYGPLAQELAAKGANIMATLGKSTTMLVVADNRPFSPGTINSALYRQAKQQIESGKPLKILALDEIRGFAEAEPSTQVDQA